MGMFKDMKKALRDVEEGQDEHGRPKQKPDESDEAFAARKREWGQSEEDSAAFSGARVVSF